MERAKNTLTIASMAIAIVLVYFVYFLYHYLFAGTHLLLELEVDVQESPKSQLPNSLSAK